MSAREEILASVRAALASAPAPPEVPRGYRSAAEGDGEAAVLDRFAERVAEYRAIVVRCTPDSLGSALAGALDGLDRVVVPEGLPWSVEDAVVDTGLTSAELDQVDAVVTGAAVGIARTGTIVLDHGAGQGRRALSLVPDRHVCVVLASQVVAGVPEAVARLDPARPQTWVSGPSATSDIELDRVEGVHGPRHLTVLLVESG
jgi:L-lactate dehydrogenase complex protein LldG